MGRLLELAKRLSRVAVPPVLPAEKRREPLEPSSLLEVPPVLPVPSKKHKAEKAEQPVASHPSPAALAWLECVAHRLGCSPAFLLERGFIDQRDLAEQYHSDPARAVVLIRSNPDWAGPEAVSAPSHVDGTDEPQRGVHTAATASPEWIAVRDRYIGHLMTCRGCHAPLGRYCATGADLCAQYAASPWS